MLSASHVKCPKSGSPEPRLVITSGGRSDWLLKREACTSEMSVMWGNLQAWSGISMLSELRIDCWQLKPL